MYQGLCLIWTFLFFVISRKAIFVLFTLLPAVVQGKASETMLHSAAAVRIEVFRDVDLSSDVKGEIGHLLFVHVLSLRGGGKVSFTVTLNFLIDLPRWRELRLWGVFHLTLTRQTLARAVAWQPVDADKEKLLGFCVKGVCYWFGVYR